MGIIEIPPALVSLGTLLGDTQELAPRVRRAGVLTHEPKGTAIAPGEYFPRRAKSLKIS